MSSWSKSLRKTLEKLESLEPKDRIDYVSAIYTCLEAIRESLHGWAEWLLNPILMDRFDEKSLLSFYSFHKESALTYLQNDAKMFKKLNLNTAATEKAIQEIEELPQKDRLGYVAATAKCLFFLENNVNGLYTFFQNPSRVNVLDAETCKELYEFKKGFALKFLKYDLEVTERYEKKKVPPNYLI